MKGVLPTANVLAERREDVSGELQMRRSHQKPDEFLTTGFGIVFVHPPILFEFLYGVPCQLSCSEIIQHSIAISHSLVETTVMMQITAIIGRVSKPAMSKRVLFNLKLHRSVPLLKSCFSHNPILSDQNRIVKSNHQNPKLKASAVIPT